MLPRDRFDTTSSKSTTNKQSNQKSSKQPNQISDEETPIQFVKGVGPRLGSVFNHRQIYTVKDLFLFFPRGYEDRSKIWTVSKLEDGVKASLTVSVVSQRRIPIRKLGKSLLEVRCADSTGILSLKWFYSPKGIERKFVPGLGIRVTGKVRFYLGKPEIVHPEIAWGVSSDDETGPNLANPNFGRIVPIYTEIEGVSTRTLRKVLWEAIETFGQTIQEDIPQYLLERRSLPGLPQAVRELHFPSEPYNSNDQLNLSSLEDCATPAHQRLIYGEFFKFEYLIIRKRLNLEKAKAPVLGASRGPKCVQSLVQSLPFQLTAGQLLALEEIQKDFLGHYPMNRLVQGDVGSGKTAVALLTAAYILAENGQVALMAPTEILAEQHFKNIHKLFSGRINSGDLHSGAEGFQVALLTGKTSSAARQSLQARLASGEPLLVIGTHALIEDSVCFSNLAYVIVDEQHRFGVEQRRTLKQKGVRKPESGGVILPHSLTLTATPIPRTLALTAFGDLSVTSIRELPPGRSPIITRLVREAQRKNAYEQIRAQLKSGRQAYFIYPLIHESEAEGFTQLKSAVLEAERLAKSIFPEFSIGLLHGQMSSDEKERAMAKFQKGENQVLVSTTVVEVGVDVPNATVMAIEHAERFGLSQLHQLRGRVGRGQFQSYCYLFSSSQTSRLEVLEETHDGFKIAEADLEIRGPGEFLGTRQAGALPFKVAQLVRDREWLFKARDDAMEILSQDPELLRPEHSCLKRYHQREGGVQQDRLMS